MLFYPTRRGTGSGCNRHSSPRPISTGEAGDAKHLTWMLKSFVMGITLLGLSYWLVQIAGVQYLASLTSATLLAFLLVYVVWYMLHRNRQPRQTLASGVRMEASSSSAMVGSTSGLPPTPPPPFDGHQAYKFHTAVPPRDSSPPPSYEEAVRAMMAMTATTPGFIYPVSSPDSQPASPVTATIPPTMPPGLTLRSSSSPTRPVQSFPYLPFHSTSTTAISSVPFLTSTRAPSVLAGTPSSAFTTSLPSTLTTESVPIIPMSTLTISASSSPFSSNLHHSSSACPYFTSSSSMHPDASPSEPSAFVPSLPRQTSSTTTITPVVTATQSSSTSTISISHQFSPYVSPYFTSSSSVRPDISSSESSAFASSSPRQKSSATTATSVVTQSSSTSIPNSTSVQPVSTTSSSVPTSVELPLLQRQNSTSSKTNSLPVIQSSCMMSSVNLTPVVSHQEQETPSSPCPSSPLPAPVFTHFDMGDI